MTVRVARTSSGKDGSRAIFSVSLTTSLPQTELALPTAPLIKARSSSARCVRTRAADITLATNRTTKITTVTTTTTTTTTTSNTGFTTTAAVAAVAAIRKKKKKRRRRKKKEKPTGGEVARRRGRSARAGATSAKMTRKKMSIFALAAAETEREIKLCAQREKGVGAGAGGGGGGGGDDDTQADAAGSNLPELFCELSSPVLDFAANTPTGGDKLPGSRMRNENGLSPLFARDERRRESLGRDARETEKKRESGEEFEREAEKEEEEKEEGSEKKIEAPEINKRREEEAGMTESEKSAEFLGKAKVKVSFGIAQVVEIDTTNTVEENPQNDKTLSSKPVTTKQRSSAILTMPGNERLAVVVALCSVIGVGVGGVATSAFLFTLTTAFFSCCLFYQRFHSSSHFQPFHHNNEDFHRGFPWWGIDSFLSATTMHLPRRTSPLFPSSFNRHRYSGLSMGWLQVFAACLLLGANTAQARYNLGSRLHNGFSTGQNCPQRCACIGVSVDCSFRGLRTVPTDIPPDTERLDLKGNNITLIRRNDFTGLRNIRVLQLPENRITKIERGAFQDLIAMERLRLNDNLLTDIPDLLFANMPKLYRLDLSYNKLTNVGRKTLKGAPLLKNLQMDNNQIKCITESAIRNLHDMEILTINKNNITAFPKDIFSNMKKLRILRIGDNHLVCDCHLNWLASWLRQNPRLGLFTKCFEPESLRGQAIEGLQGVDFRCNGYERHHSKECLSEMQCPRNCLCSEGVIDCRGQGLKDIPDVIPESTTDLRLDENHIARIPAKAFAEYKNLRRIDLGNNEISYIASDAFTGLSSLNSLILYGNKINDLPQGIFRGLTSLQLLLLNANKISCIREDTFEDLRNLNLLSLYDNKIQTLPNGTFQPLKNIQTLHLARNPFICDCNLRWLSEYLHSYPVETSGARCESPRRMRRKKIGSIRDTKFKCKGSEHQRTKYGNCVTNRDCPRDCDCSGTIVDCTGRSLTKIPDMIPMYVTELKLVNNDITRIETNSVLKRLPNLQILDFKNNKISTIEDGALDGLEKLQELILTYNKLNKISSSTFRGLTNLMILKLASNRISCVDNETYNMMPNLRFLSMFDNQIRCIMEGAFNKLHYLSTLNIMSNPFNCNCHLSWLPEWLKRKTIVSGRPVCFTPHKFKDMPILSLTAKDLVCEDTNNNEIGCNVGTTPCCPSGIMDKMENSCDPRAYCPPNCTCSGTIVRCIKQNLKFFPKDIPMDTTDLYLDFNNISIIPKDISRLTKLTQLDLSNNQLVTLPDHAFANLSHLSTLILSYNPLQCISETSFSGLTQLRILSLHENKLSTIPYGTFKDLHSITHLVLGGNPLYCDCNLKWLSDWIKKDFLEAGIATCSGPEPMAQKLLLTTPSQNFQCDREPDPAVLSKCNACYENPCQHGSKCTLVSFKNFTCTCAPGYYGTKCENEIDACFGNPCFRGTCEVKENGRFKCHCPRGFDGYRCEVNIDDCVSHSCQNNATCIDQIETYTCKCPIGYTGKQCQNKIVFCEAEYNFCQNGASCKQHTDDYTCECPLGYTGKNCSENFDDCKSHICQNGAKCRDELNGYTCMCPTGYLGKFCEIAPLQISGITAPGVCLQHECQNNGLCFQPSSTSDYMCRCASGFSGKKCEKLHQISFREKDAYIALTKVDVDPQLNITMTFSTKQDSGILLYTGAEQHIAAELFRGRIRISFDVGNYPLSNMFSFEAVADGNFHKFQMLVEKTNLTMTVDSGAPRTVVNDGPNKKLMVDDPIYLGGLPADVKERASKKWHIREGSSFIGCFQKVIINGHQQDFSSSLYNHKMIPGCQELKKVDPCANHKCKNGKCTPRKGDTYKCRCRQGYTGEWCDIGLPNPVKKVNPCNNHQCKQGKCTPQKDNSYKCRCRRGYSGKHCDIAPTCRDIVYRDTYKDPKTSCVSRTKVKFRRCEGSCGRHCCKPKKIKTRRIRLFCVDGNNFIYNLPVIRKCGCKRC